MDSKLAFQRVFGLVVKQPFDHFTFHIDEGVDVGI